MLIRCVFLGCFRRFCRRGQRGPRRTGPSPHPEPALRPQPRWLLAVRLGVRKRHFRPGVRYPEERRTPRGRGPGSPGTGLVDRPRRPSYPT